MLLLQASTATRSGVAHAAASDVASRTAIATAYGAPQAYQVSFDYPSPPHLSRTTHYRRPVYVYGLFDHWEVLHALTQSEHACAESLGPSHAQGARVIQDGGTSWLEIRYSQDVLHSNPRYGSFVVGTTTIVERERVDTAAAADNSPAAAVRPAQGLDVALRTLDSVQEFADYLLVSQSNYARDIEDAFELGLIQGKYDDNSRFYDPEGLITVGEMLNILARNLGAPTSSDGPASLTYLSSLGVSGPGDLRSQLTLAQLESLASQVASLDRTGKGDLLVIREAVAGALEPDRDGGITRAHAVAMFRPSLALVVPPSETHLPDPVPSGPDEWSGGGNGSHGGSDVTPAEGEGPRPAGPGQGGGEPSSSTPPLFVLTD
jgi:hypothetical protein